MDLVCPRCSAAFSAEQAEKGATEDVVSCPACGQRVEKPEPEFELTLELAGSSEGVSDPSAAEGSDGGSSKGALANPSLDLGLTVDDLAAEEASRHASRDAERQSDSPPLPQQPVRLELGPDKPAGARDESRPPVATAARGGVSPRSGAAKVELDAGPDRGRGGAFGVSRSDPAVRVKDTKGASARVAVMVSAEETGLWRRYGAVAGTAVLAIVVVSLVSFFRGRPPPPPTMPNPLRERVAAWQAAGERPTFKTVEASLRAARAGLASGSDQGLRQARAAVRSALLLDVDSPAAISLFGRVLAQWPDLIDEELLNDGLGGITSAIGEAPDSVFRAELELARGWVSVRLGRMEAARQATERGLALDPDGIALRLVYAVTLIRTQPADAVRELEALHGVDSPPPRLALWKGEAYLAAGRAEKAMAIWSEALAKRPDDIGVLRRLARLSLDRGDDSAATKQLEQIRQAGWASVEDRLILAQLLAKSRRTLGAALSCLDDGLADPTVSPLNRARLLAAKAAAAATARPRLFSDREISQWLDQGLEVAPDLPELLLVAGLIDYRSGATQSAIELLEAANELAPEQPEVATALAVVLKIESIESANQVVKAALRESPQYVPLHLAQALVLLDAGRRDLALSAVRRALDFDPVRSAGAARGLGSMLLASTIQGQIGRELLRHLRGPDDAMLLTAAGLAYFFANDSRKAMGLFARAIRADPNGVPGRLGRAILLVTKGKPAQATRDLEAASRTDSQHRVVRYYRARLLEFGKDRSAAERAYRDLLAENPLNSAARMGLARALRARRADAEARKEALKVLTVRPHDREALQFFLRGVSVTASPKRD